MGKARAYSKADLQLLLFNLLVTFAFSRLQQFKMMVMQGLYPLPETSPAGITEVALGPLTRHGKSSLAAIKLGL